MCGIIYSHNLNGHAVNDYVLQQYKKQKARGQEGFGIYDGQENNLIHEPGEVNIKKWLRKYPSNILMFHHRKPTSTANVRRACHPFSTGDYFGDTEYVMVHNGYISNEWELYEEHTDIGIQYRSVLQDGTFNDSESLAWDFALTMEGKQDKIKATGGMAFICMKLVKGQLTNLYFGRNSARPLMVKRKTGKMYIASEGGGSTVPIGMLQDYDYLTDGMSSKAMEFPLYAPYTPLAPADDFDWPNWRPNQGNHYPYADNGLSDVPELPMPIRGGDWLGNVLRKKFNVKPMVRYELGDDDQVHEVKMSTNLRYDNPDDVVMWYLVQNDGVFEKAYWAMEHTYLTLTRGDVEEAESTGTPDMRKINIMEEALDLISRDDEYIDEQSVSSVWEALWSKV